jgi:hypothetical protein
MFPPASSRIDPPRAVIGSASRNRASTSPRRSDDPPIVVRSRSRLVSASVKCPRRSDDDVVAASIRRVVTDPRRAAPCRSHWWCRERRCSCPHSHDRAARPGRRRQSDRRASSSAAPLPRFAVARSVPPLVSASVEMLVPARSAMSSPATMVCAVIAPAARTATSKSAEIAPLAAKFVPASAEKPCRRRSGPHPDWRPRPAGWCG